MFNYRNHKGFGFIHLNTSKLFEHGDKPYIYEMRIKITSLITL